MPINPGLILPNFDSDGKQVVTPSPATTGWKTYFTGAGDQLSPLVRGGGTKLLLEWDNVEARGMKSVTIQFGEPVEIHDGQAFYNPTADWDTGDIIEFYVQIDPNTTTVASPANTGNCNLTDLGGYNLITPAAGDGTDDIDLSTAIPVPSSDNTGYYDVDYTTGAVTASATPGAAEWNLIDTLTTKIYFLRNIPLGNAYGTFDIDTYKVDYIHQSYKLVMEVTKNSANAGKIAAWVQLFRESAS